MGSRQLSLVDHFMDNRVVTLVSEADVVVPSKEEKNAPNLKVMKDKVKLAETLAREMIKAKHSVENAKDVLAAIDLWRKGDNGYRKRKDGNIPPYKPHSPHLFQTIEKWYERNVGFLS